VWAIDFSTRSVYNNLILWISQVLDLSHKSIPKFRA
jgi:hypothetical protein